MQSKPCFPSKLPCRGLCLLTAEIFLRRHAGLGLEDAVEIVQIVIADLRGGLLDRHAAQQELLRLLDADGIIIGGKIEYVF